MDGKQTRVHFESAIIQLRRSGIFIDRPPPFLLLRSNPVRGAIWAANLPSPSLYKLENVSLVLGENSNSDVTPGGV